jgi:aminoglycoside phosphotransferase (APT) family kinase protein
MPADEVGIDASLVSRLLSAQFPQWAGLSVEPVSSAGTDNAIFRLGEDMAVRLPRLLRCPLNLLVLRPELVQAVGTEGSRRRRRRAG